MIEGVHRRICFCLFFPQVPHASGILLRVHHFGSVARLPCPTNPPLVTHCSGIIGNRTLKKKPSARATFHGKFHQGNLFAKTPVLDRRLSAALRPPSPTPFMHNTLPPIRSFPVHLLEFAVGPNLRRERVRFGARKPGRRADLVYYRGG